MDAASARTERFQGTVIDFAAMSLESAVSCFASSGPCRILSAIEHLIE